jgi:hypothetical protein
MNKPHFDMQDPSERALGVMVHYLTKKVHVISVGAVDRGSMVHDTLLKVPRFHLTIATDYRALWATPKREDFQVAVLHNTLSSFELEEACRFIRQTWPHARILVIRAGEGFLDDALYDERVLPRVAERFLLSAIERLADGAVKRRVGNGEL